MMCVSEGLLFDESMHAIDRLIDRRCSGDSDMTEQGLHVIAPFKGDGSERGKLMACMCVSKGARVRWNRVWQHVF